MPNLLSNKLIDFVYFGSYDLSIENQKAGDIFDIKILDNMKYLKEIASKNNKKIMAIYRTTEELGILNNIGVDIYISTSSAGGGLQMMVVGVVKNMTGESAQRAADFIFSLKH